MYHLLTLIINDDLPHLYKLNYKAKIKGKNILLFGIFGTFESWEHIWIS
jgi:hypothetical protein